MKLTLTRVLLIAILVLGIILFFLLVNDAAAAQLRMAGSKMEAPASRELDHRRQTGMELLRIGDPTGK